MELSRLLLQLFCSNEPDIKYIFFNQRTFTKQKTFPCGYSLWRPSLMACVNFPIPIIVARWKCAELSSEPCLMVRWLRPANQPDMCAGGDGKGNTPSSGNWVWKTKMSRKCSGCAKATIWNRQSPKGQRKA